MGRETRVKSRSEYGSVTDPQRRAGEEAKRATV